MTSPQTFGKYQLLERIALGGMAEIYRAKTYGAAGFEKELCIKRILPQFSADDDFVRMFIDEARLAAKLQHTNIVQIFDFDSAETEGGQSYYIAMELVEGKDVRHLLKEGIRRQVPLSVPMCLHVAIETLKGLHYAHAKADGGKPLNIVHRDVSPHNVLVSYAGEVKISDFGIAKAAARASATSNGMVKGKLAYMSPEQVTGQPLDRRTDVYSMGIVLYEMLTRTRLFAGATDAEVITKVRDAVVPPLRQRNAQVPPDVEAAVMKMLQHDVRQRYQSAADAAKALSQTSAYSANEAAPIGDLVATLFPLPQRRSTPAPAPAPAARPAATARPATQQRPAAAAPEMATMMAEAPSAELIARAKAERAGGGSASGNGSAPKPTPITDASTAILDPSSPQHAQIQAQVQAAIAAKQGGPPAAAAAAPKPITEASTAILDPSSPQHAQIQAQVQAAIANKGGPPPGAAPKPISEASTAILDASSPQHAQIQAQVQAAIAARGGGGGGRVASGGPPPAAPPMASSGPPPAAAGGSPQRTVMLDAAQAQAMVPRAQVKPAQQLAPLPTMAPKKQSTIGRWLLGPAIMLAVAGLTWYLAGVLLPAATVQVVERPPIKERPKGHIMLKTQPDGATVKIDDVELKHLTPTTIEGPIGETSHVVISLGGYKTHEEDVLFSETDKPLSIVLDRTDEKAQQIVRRPKFTPKALPDPKPVGDGTISIFVHPWAIVFLDGERLRQTPIANHVLKPGTHKFTLVNESLKKHEDLSVVIKAGSNPEIRREWAN